MTTNLSVAEAKKRFSEIMGRVVYGGERFIIEKHGTPAVAVISLEDLARLEGLRQERERLAAGTDVPGDDRDRPKRKGIAAIAGALAGEEYKEFGDIMDEVYRSRQDYMPREVNLDL
jgi:prevent-host-death family protein